MTPSADERTVARQLGRRPKPFLDVCRRCRYDYPQVILNRPVQEGSGRYEVFPTVYWLTCPLLARAISRIEAEGQIRTYEERLEKDDAFLAQMRTAHKDAAADRLRLVPEDVGRALRARQPRQWEAVAETGVAGIRSPGGVKCLHAHYADFVGRGGNPIGQDVERQLRRRGVPTAGDEDCWRHCAAAGEAPKAVRRRRRPSRPRFAPRMRIRRGLLRRALRNGRR